MRESGSNPRPPRPLPEPLKACARSILVLADGGPGACWARRRHFALDNDPYRAGFHYQPKDGHWMNDPNGPMYYGGLYHLFYQWNPVSSDAYNMHWGHAVSPDLVRWTELPFALAPDKGACGGEWSGSATPNAVIGPPVRGRSTSVVTPVLSYSVQCNNYFGQATPANLSDPLLLQWNKTFPTATKPHFVPGGFRDPSEAWRGTDGVWRQLAACTGGACLFNSSDFLKWQPDGYAVYPYGPPPHEHVAPGPGPLPARSRVRVANDEGEGREPLEWAKLALDAGNPPTWECPDLFVLPAKSRRGATAFGATAFGATASGATAFGATAFGATGSTGSAVKLDAAQPASMPAGDAPEQLWVLKASGGLTAATRSIGVDFWATGSFVERNGSFVAGPNSDALPSDGQRCDFGQYYASKSFFDPVAGERVIFGWLINFAGGAEEPPPLIEWNGVQATPRAIREDPLLARRLTFYPIDALRTLRILPPAAYQHAVTLRPQTTSPLSPAVAGSRLDIVLTFSPLPVAVELGTTFGVSVLGGAANATITAVHETTCGQVIRHSATPTLRCANLTVGPHHGPFAFSADQPLELRVLVDGSVVEAFVAGGRSAVTHRVYPSSDAPLSVAVLNRGTRAIALSTLEVYSMHAVHGLTIDALRRHRQA